MNRIYISARMLIHHSHWEYEAILNVLPLIVSGKNVVPDWYELKYTSLIFKLLEGRSQFFPHWLAELDQSRYHLETSDYLDFMKCMWNHLYRYLLGIIILGRFLTKWRMSVGPFPNLTDNCVNLTTDAIFRKFVQ